MAVFSGIGHPNNLFKIWASLLTQLTFRHNFRVPKSKTARVLIDYKTTSNLSTVQSTTSTTDVTYPDTFIDIHVEKGDIIEAEMNFLASQSNAGSRVRFMLWDDRMRISGRTGMDGFYAADTGGNAMQGTCKAIIEADRTELKHIYPKWSVDANTGYGLVGYLTVKVYREI